MCYDTFELKILDVNASTWKIGIFISARACDWADGPQTVIRYMYRAHPIAHYYSSLESLLSRQANQEVDSLDDQGAVDGVHGNDI